MDELNEHHRRRLLVSCQYVDRLLADIESVMAASSSLSPFPKYVQDLAPLEEQVLRGQVSQLRSELVEFLEARGVAMPDPAISARHSILTSLGYVDIAVEELRPRYLGGYGLVPPILIPDLNSAVGKLQRTVRAAIAALKQAMQAGEGGPEEAAL